ncbi:unnamed protein product [Effrenium voratum]|uniref:Uncharacterized protein n=1 Tax=Effrenium voratum TaxID=2562239 RepID=A0AA36J991_9DINO|nr:unnamed protein product [Effrenium voratum]
MSAERADLQLAAELELRLSVASKSRPKERRFGPSGPWGDLGGRGAENLGFGMKAARAAYRTRQISAPSLGLPVKMAEDRAGYVSANLPSDEFIDNYAKKFCCCIPLLFLTLVPFYAFFYGAIPDASKVEPHTFLVGAAGWWVALILRLPVGLAAKACLKDTESLQLASVLISGPAEEGVRVAVLVVANWAQLSHAFALGLGWTSLELLFTLAQGYATIQLLRGARQGDAKAAEAFEVLAAQSNGEPFATSPFWGVLERVSAHMLHIALRGPDATVDRSLYVAYNPWLVFATAPGHSLTNWSVLTMMKKFGIAAVEVGFFVMALAFFVAALLLWGFHF